MVPRRAAAIMLWCHHFKLQTKSFESATEKRSACRQFVRTRGECTEQTPAAESTAAGGAGAPAAGAAAEKASREAAVGLGEAF